MAPEDDLGLPTLEGKKPQDVAHLYTKAVQTRSLKMAEVLGRLTAIPVKERSDNVSSHIALSLAGLLSGCSFQSLETSAVYRV